MLKYGIKSGISYVLAYGGPEGPGPLPSIIFPITNSTFLITSFQFGYFSFPILSFLITNFQIGYFSFICKYSLLS